MKKRLFLVICLLAIASLMASMAYTWANVNNDTTVSITATDNALLAFIPNEEPPEDATVVIENGELKLNFGDIGKGLQPNSRYTWDGLFLVKNNSSAQCRFTVSDISDEFGDNNCKITMIAMGQNGKSNEYILSNNNPGKNEGVVGVWYYLEPGETVPIRVKVSVESSNPFSPSVPSGTITFMGAR